MHVNLSLMKLCDVFALNLEHLGPNNSRVQLEILKKVDKYISVVGQVFEQIINKSTIWTYQHFTEFGILATNVHQILDASVTVDRV